MKLTDLKVKDFLKELASSSPAPGGGSVSALAGANGCALIAMVGSLSFNKKKFKALDQAIQDNYKKTLELFIKNQDLFISLIDEDTDAFNSLMKAFKLPKETDEEIALRTKEIDKATLQCIKVPLKVCAIAIESLREVEDLIKYSNKNTISDQGVSVLMLYASVEGAALNVLINLPGLNDEDLKKEYEETIEEILQEANQIKEDLLEEVKYLLK